MMRLIVNVPPNEWLLANHTRHYQEAGRRRRAIKQRIVVQAKRQKLAGITDPVEIIGRAHIKQGIAPDCDGIAPMMKGAIDGLVVAGVLPDDSPKYLRAVAYEQPYRDPTLNKGWHRLEIVIKTNPQTNW